jgi:hypothetical protein
MPREARFSMPGSEAPFAALLRNPADLPRVFWRLESVIANSFKEDRARGGVITLTGASSAEVKRRYAICEKWFRVFRGDLGWSLEKTLDFWPVALRKELDGETWEPPKGDTGWAPSATGVEDVELAKE